MKKLVSMLLVLAMLVTVFAGLAITASAADAVLTVYTQAGADGEKTLAKSYTAEELKKLAETKADGYGYQYFKKGEQDVVVTEYVTLDTLLTDADVSFADGDSLAFVCDDGPYTKFNPTYKDIIEGKYSFKDELHMNASTVRSRLLRGREALRKTLTKGGLFCEDDVG